MNKNILLIATIAVTSLGATSGYFLYRKNKNKTIPLPTAPVKDKETKENENNQPLEKKEPTKNNNQKTKKDNDNTKPKEKEEEKWYFSWKGELFFSTTTLLVFFIVIVTLTKCNSEMEKIRKERDKLISQTYNDHFSPFIKLVEQHKEENFSFFREKVTEIDNYVKNINDNLFDSKFKYDKAVTNYHKFLTVFLSIIYVPALVILIASPKTKNKKGFECFKILLFVLIKRINFFLYSLPFILIEYIVLNFIIRKIFITDNEIKMDEYISLAKEILVGKLSHVMQDTNVTPIAKLKIPYIFIPYEQTCQQIKNSWRLHCYNFLVS